MFLDLAVLNRMCRIFGRVHWDEDSRVRTCYNTVWQYSRASNPRYSLVHIYGYKMPGYCQTQLMLLWQWKQVFRTYCLGKYSRVMQLRISFWLACYHVLLVVNLFSSLKSRTRMDGIGAWSVLCLREMALATLTQCESRLQDLLVSFHERYEKLIADHPDVKKMDLMRGTNRSNREACW
jgi:hypothetical protein